MTREEAQRQAALHWLIMWPLIESSVVKTFDGDDLRMVQHEKMLIRRRLQRLAKPKHRTAPSPIVSNGTSPKDTQQGTETLKPRRHV